MWRFYINNLIKVTISSANHSQTIKLLKFKCVNIYNIVYDNSKIIIIINKKDIDKITKLFNVLDVKYVGIRSLFDKPKSFFVSIFFLFIFVLLISLYSCFIVKIELNTVNSELRSYILNELDRNCLKENSFVVNDQRLLEIKKKVLETGRDKLEWLNIERVGMKYKISLEEKKDKNPESMLDYCNIIATKDGTITKVISSSGSAMVDVNDSVKKDDGLISGDII